MTFFRFLFTKAFLKQLLLAVLALVVLSFLVMWWLKGTTNHGQKIEVPSLSKLSLDLVEDKLNEMDLRYEILDSANYNPDFPKYSVIEQIPKAGKFVKEDRKIYLYLNPSGYRKIQVPNVIGRTRRQAEPTLLAMGFEIGKISYRPDISDQVKELRYKGERLEPGTEIQKTAVIDLIVGDESLNRVQEANDAVEEETQPTETENNDQ
ncbi:PASTA domain-containing protein [Marixanthomonas ophiurae]|uniref:PASTA domain-containing protein n=1 Tax=Marixanthomonas ophiurae TaxID=387659 RepID=A0A3E1QCU6_9FLAO|nr:PASTA domain-containing protein [Marixanthomonas ophiurae]RFN59896.1 PASTA domain-containing protein [Marixanthomonas ophiurae]|tara:strand:+ start:13211 stop:13831 length:621 start_codon:yes stop_codon:yes gene_type:complete